jgi:2'-5' RNA ligase
MTPEGEMLRLFFALPLDEAATCLSGVREELGRFPRILRTVAPEHYHVTLKFLGDTHVETMRRIVEVFLSLDLGPAGPLPFAMEGLGAFPGLSSPRVIWCGLRLDAQALGMVRSPIEDLCGDHGFAAESRLFRPHLTLARLRRDAGAPGGLTEYLSSRRNARFGESVFNRIVLFRSDLDRKGPRYTVLAERALGENC